MSLFDRQIIVEVGPPGGTGVLFEDFYIKFKGKKTIKRSANKLTVEIYNLTDETHKQIAEDGNVCILQAGYKEDDLPKVLFTGDITRTIKEYSSPDLITKIECFDGIKKLREKKISFSYDKGTRLTTVVNDIVKNFELPLANEYVLSSFQFTNGFTFIGSTKDALTKALSIADFDYSIQDGQIQIIEEDQVSETGIVISTESGMIGSPESLTEVAGKVKKSKAKKQKYKVMSVLFPEINIGDAVKIKSKDVDGFYKVLDHEFEGDNKSGNWKSTLEVTAL
jgi:hypothetical protein